MGDPVSRGASGCVGISHSRAHFPLLMNGMPGINGPLSSAGARSLAALPDRVVPVPRIPRGDGAPFTTHMTALHLEKCLASLPIAGIPPVGAMSMPAPGIRPRAALFADVRLGRQRKGGGH